MDQTQRAVIQFICEGEEFRGDQSGKREIRGSEAAGDWDMLVGS